jgi:hypothetical protein
VNAKQVRRARSGAKPRKEGFARSPGGAESIIAILLQKHALAGRWFVSAPSGSWQQALQWLFLSATDFRRPALGKSAGEGYLARSQFPSNPTEVGAKPSFEM